MRFLILLKALLLFSMVVAGTLLLLAGLSIEIPLVKLNGLEAHGVPVGLAVIFAGIALAHFWKIGGKTSESFSSVPVSPSAPVYTPNVPVPAPQQFTQTSTTTTKTTEWWADGPKKPRDDIIV
jgi:hypothetical protein